MDPPTLMRCPWGKKKVDLGRVALTVKKKKWFVQQITTKQKTAPQLAKKYNLKADTLSFSAKKVREGGVLFETGGRPPILNAESDKRTAAFVDSPSYKENTESYREFVRLEAIKSAKDRNIAIPNTDYVGRHPEKRSEARLGIATGVAEVSTDARILACADIRNAVSFAALQNLMVEMKKVDPLLILNFDTTQFTVGGTSDQNVEVKYVVKNEAGGPKKKKSMKTKLIRITKALLSILSNICIL